MADEKQNGGAAGQAPGANGKAGGAQPSRESQALPEQPHHEVEERLAAAIAEAAEFRDLYLRSKAEVENVRRRAQDDVAKAHKFAIEGFAESLLPVKDSLEMALRTEAPSIESLREGVDATLRLLASAFERNRLVEIDPAGQKFDPNLHQAISMVPASATQPPVAPNHVVTVLQKGYLIADRVLRPALVTVAQA